jgi:hypothetical protein
MRPDLILGQLPRDLACAIALGMVEAPRVGINLQSITLLDAQMRPADKLDNWLDGDDPLDVATRDYLKARQDAIHAGRPRFGQTGWAAAGAGRAREEAVKRSLVAKTTAQKLLVERGVLEHARSIGMHVIEEA